MQNTVHAYGFSAFSCVRWAHVHCSKAPLYICGLEGCSSAEQDAESKKMMRDLIVTWFELVTRENTRKNKMEEQKVLHRFVMNILD